MRVGDTLLAMSTAIVFGRCGDDTGVDVALLLLVTSLPASRFVTSSSEEDPS